MQIVQGDEMPILKGASNVRAGELKKQQFLVGEENTAGNFKVGLFFQTGDFYSPRHRHNFEQFRFQIEGDCEFERNGKMKPGVVGYFPEGAFYGPQSSENANVVVVMQFGGPSGSGFLSQTQVDAAYYEMKKYGTFDKGVYRRNEGVPGKKNMDSFQAVWEFANKRPMVYAKPQYNDPVIMNPETFRWQPVAGAPGVEEKTFGLQHPLRALQACAGRAVYRQGPGGFYGAVGQRFRGGRSHAPLHHGLFEGWRAGDVPG
jgi:hypothetical protein